MNQHVFHVVWGGNLGFSLAVQHLKGHLVITSSFRGLSVSWAKGKSKRDCECLFVLYESSPPPPHALAFPSVAFFLLHSFKNTIPFAVAQLFRHPTTERQFLKCTCAY